MINNYSFLIHEILKALFQCSASVFNYRKPSLKIENKVSFSDSQCDSRQFFSDFLLDFTWPSHPIYNSLPIPKQNKLDKNNKLYLKNWDDTEVENILLIQ